MLTLLLGLALLFFLTRKKYVFKLDKPIFIPKLSFSTSSTTEIEDIAKLKKMLGYLDVKFRNGQWVVSIKPINDIKIPFEIKLPATAPLALPQIAYQLKTKLLITPVRFANKTLGYMVSLKEPIVIYI